MENNVLKVLTLGAIGAGIYLILRGQQAGAVPGAQVLVCSGKCNLKPAPMESSTCAIPLAADYLVCNPAHVPAVSNVSKPAPMVVRPVAQATLACNYTVDPFAVKAPPAVPAPISVAGLCNVRSPLVHHRWKRNRCGCLCCVSCC